MSSHIHRTMPSNCALASCTDTVLLGTPVCRFCSKLYCLKHLQYEVHGCGDQKKYEAQVQHFQDNKQPARVASNPDLKGKLHAKLSEKSNQRARKPPGKAQKR